MPFNIIINQEVIDVAFLSRAPSWRDVIDGEPFLEVAPCCLSFQGAFILKDTACLPLISDKLPSRSYQLEGVGQVLLLIVGLTKKKLASIALVVLLHCLKISTSTAGAEKRSNYDAEELKKGSTTSAMQSRCFAATTLLHNGLAA